MDDARLGFLFGVFAGVLLFLEAFLTVIVGLTSLVISGFSSHLVVGEFTHIVLAVVLGLLFIFFAAVGGRRAGMYTPDGRRQGDSSLAAGVILIVLAIGTWYVLGLHLLDALGGIFGLVGGILLVMARR